jgi:hypothetical protein
MKTLIRLSKKKKEKIVKTFVISVVTTLALLFIGYTVSNRGMALQYEKQRKWPISQI